MRPHRRARWLLLCLALVIGLIAWLRYADRPAWLDGAPAWAQAAVETIRGEAGAGSAPLSSERKAAVPVRVAQVSIRDVPVEFRSVGTIEAVESVAIRARVDGVVERVLVDDGAMVKAGDVLVELDQEPIQAQIDQQEANIRRDRAQLANARLVFDRATDLAKRGATAKQSLDDARTEVEALTAGVAASEAQLRSLQLELSYHRISAPFDGRIGRVQVSPGTIVRGSDSAGTIATLNQVDPIYVALGVPQNQLGDLSEALQAGTAQIEVPLPGSTETRSGPVVMVENAVERGTGLVTVRARLDNHDQRLWPGTVLDARLVLREEKGALVVPSDAVQISQTGSFLFIVDQNQKARVVPVQVGRTVDDVTVLVDGPPAGTTVVTEGQIRLVDGTLVHIAESAQGLEARR
ncbi:efflux RND transporter periplasmic adaptor subunit [Geminicoccus roseus]|uniref:efflux RND transporter periplasmic adaptor subunit n=1 Tax=Geminicoccus roseus TaxID=404900 RepID=UPI00040D1836|nr:efflux RND transporter periplasmic adaptor subunit [Geminicoccus roseus]